MASFILPPKGLVILNAAQDVDTPLYTLPIAPSYDWLGKILLSVHVCLGFMMLVGLAYLQFGNVLR